MRAAPVHVDVGGLLQGRDDADDAVRAVGRHRAGPARVHTGPSLVGHPAGDADGAEAELGPVGAVEGVGGVVARAVRHDLVVAGGAGVDGDAVGGHHGGPGRHAVVVKRPRVDDVLGVVEGQAGIGGGVVVGPQGEAVVDEVGGERAAAVADHVLEGEELVALGHSSL